MVTSPEAKAVNKMDERMTRAQVARRKFKSSLPRKIENRRLSAMGALGEAFKLFDRFRGMVVEEGQDPDTTLHAALAYCLPESEPATLGKVIHLRKLPWVGDFCNEVMALDRPLFLGVVFTQFDPDTENPNYKFASFCALFMGGPEAEGRLLYARQTYLDEIKELTQNLRQ